ncbi:protein FAM24A-like [Acomys russatus]|uniref:protein FAM24A-like n=1 Tax=Acomys russatus TaxID=60746 RepID=UPI0021E2DE20|nr:protein FAM24A-like [Acomys russatus]
MFDLRTKVMIGIAGSLLVAAIMLITVVLCLYLEIAKALKTAKRTRAAEKSIDPCKDTQDKISPAKGNTSGSSHNLQYCDDCSIYADVDPLPPCFCGKTEGL